MSSNSSITIICLCTFSEAEDIENTDQSKWELKCPSTVDSVFIMATSKDVTCIKLLQLNKESDDEKTLYLELDTDPEVMPMTLMLIGLQTITKGEQKYYKVQAEAYTEINEEMSCIDLSFNETQGILCGAKLFECADTRGTEIAVKHRLGTKYWIRTEPSSRKLSTKIIILQHLETREMYFFFTENSWQFKSIPFTLTPCSEYRCMTFYGSTKLSEEQQISFKCKSSQESEFDKNYKVYKTSKICTFTAYMTKTEIQKLMNLSVKFVNRTDNKFGRIDYFYRNKSKQYFKKILRENNGIMETYMKDNNGDRYSVINKNLEGLFFSALLESKTLKPPPTSVFGTRRMFMRAPFMFNQNAQVYFADFYCNFYIHYVTLVITEPNSKADMYCRSRLLKLNSYNNPYIKLVLVRGEYMVYVTLNVHVELFYTESIDINRIRDKQDGFLFEDVPIRGKGRSCPDGIAKKVGCKICNLE